MPKPIHRLPVASFLQFLPLLTPAVFLCQTYIFSSLPPLLLFGSWVPYIGGFGYVYLRRWDRSFWASFGYGCMLVVASCVLLAGVGSIVGSRLTLLCWGLACLALSLLCAADVWPRINDATPTARNSAPSWEGWKDLARGCFLLAVIAFVDFIALFAVEIVMICYFGPTCL